MKKFYIEVRMRLYAAEPNKIVASGVMHYDYSIHDAADRLVQEQLGDVDADFWTYHYFDFVDVTGIA